MNPPATQSIATQCLVRMRFVSGGRGSVLTGSGYAGYAPGGRSPPGDDMSRSEPTSPR